MSAPSVTASSRSRRRGSRFWREAAAIAAIAIVLSWLLKTFLLQAFFIPSESMENTLLKGDRIVVNKLAPGPMDLRRGDVVVFRDPGNWLPDAPAHQRSLLSPAYDALAYVGLMPPRTGDDLVKRIIGVGGDEVECAGPGQPILVNKVPLDEPYLYPGDVPSEVAFRVRVPDGHLWVMGDHRSASGDSRAHQDASGGFGFVPMENVVGRAAALVWPVWRGDGLGRPDTFNNPALQPGIAR